MRLSPLCDRWESAYSTTSTTGSFWPSRRRFYSSHKTLLLSHLGCLGLCQEHTVTQPTSFLPGHSYRLSADDSNCLSGVSRNNSTPRGSLKEGTARLLKAFQRMLGLMAVASPVLQLVCFTCDPSISG